MLIHILRKQLDSSTLCPLCRAAMYWVDAEQFDQDLYFHECSHCEHRIFQDTVNSCHCKQCTQVRKKSLKQAKVQEVQRYNRIKDVNIQRLEHVDFMYKLFLLAVLDPNVREDSQHQEFIAWDHIKYAPISPNYYFQSHLVKLLKKDQIFQIIDQHEDTEKYYIQARLDGYAEPSLFSITQQLRVWFFENLSEGIPFKNSDEVKTTLYHMLYQEVIQFAQSVCKTWRVQIAGHHTFQKLCYTLLDTLSVEQIFYLVHTALTYLYQQNALETRNENFVNTHRLKKTVMQYRERAILEKWETPRFPRPEHLPFSRMSQILYYDFLGYDEKIFQQPVWYLWKKIEPRLSFFSEKRCMHCGSMDLDVEFDAQSYVSLRCRTCKHQDHYFTQ